MELSGPLKSDHQWCLQRGEKERGQSLTRRPSVSVAKVVVTQTPTLFLQFAAVDSRLLSTTQQVKVANYHQAHNHCCLPADDTLLG